MYARFDKHGRSLPDTGRGCGCGQCAAARASLYERLRRWLAAAVAGKRPGRPQVT